GALPTTRRRNTEAFLYLAGGKSFLHRRADDVALASPAGLDRGALCAFIATTRGLGLTRRIRSASGGYGCRLRGGFSQGLRSFPLFHQRQDLGTFIWVVV